MSAPDIRSVELAHGVQVRSYRKGDTTYWRVVMPRWAKGTWLDTTDALFPSLEDALHVLTETGTLESLAKWWDARMDESRARQAFFSRAMDAYSRREKL